jgi:mono/diheme cytochrome c family protein
MIRREWAKTLCGLAAGAVLAGCGDGGSSGPALSPEAQRGKTVYTVNCTACHAADPNLAGGLGPDVAGSSLELLEARVLRAEFPPGYTPKRDSRVMIALPHLEPDIPALHAYLAETAK